MNYRTFALLLAGVVMLLGTTAGWLIQEERRSNGTGDEELGTEITQTEPPQDAIQWKEQFAAPVTGQIIQPFGAYYDDHYGQWTMNVQIQYAAEPKEPVYSPLSGQVKTISPCEEGGSLVVLECGDVDVGLYPIYNVRIFERSKIKQGAFVGETGGMLMIYVQRESQMIDPYSVGSGITFSSPAGGEPADVE